jgi:hypothetical protein
LKKYQNTEFYSNIENESYGISKIVELSKCGIKIFAEFLGIES